MEYLILGPMGNIYDQQGTASGAIKKLQDLRSGKYKGVIIKSKFRKKLIIFEYEDLKNHLSEINFPGNCGRIYFSTLMKLIPYKEEAYND